MARSYPWRGGCRALSLSRRPAGPPRYPWPDALLHDDPELDYLLVRTTCHLAQVCGYGGTLHQTMGRDAREMNVVVMGDEIEDWEEKTEDMELDKE